MSIGLSIDGERSYYLTNHLGSISAVTDDTGAITSETRYTPLGCQSINPAPTLSEMLIQVMFDLPN